jgi:hypothetical protein
VYNAGKCNGISIQTERNKVLIFLWILNEDRGSHDLIPLWTHSPLRDTGT